MNQSIDLSVEEIMITVHNFYYDRKDEVYTQTAQ